MTALSTILSKHPRLRDWLTAEDAVEPLGGLTNSNRLVVNAQGKFVLRIPGPGTNEYINREWEQHAALTVSALGVNAPVLYFDDKTGIQLCRYVEAATMSAEGFKDLDRVARAGRSLRRVHESSVPFLNRFELFAMMDNYLAVLEAKQAALPTGFLEVKREAETVRRALGRHPVPIVPCHCDPLAENFLDDGSNSFIIDWEYSGNNDPMWDLADLSVEAQFSSEQDEALIRSYFPDGCRPFDRGRITLYKAMCDLLWTLWGVIQHTQGNAADDFWSYSLNRFARCQRLMESAEFERDLSAVMSG